MFCCLQTNKWYEFLYRVRALKKKPVENKPQKTSSANGIVAKNLWYWYSSKVKVDISDFRTAEESVCVFASVCARRWASEQTLWHTLPTTRNGDNVKSIYGSVVFFFIFFTSHPPNSCASYSFRVYMYDACVCVCMSVCAKNRCLCQQEYHALFIHSFHMDWVQKAFAAHLKKNKQLNKFKLVYHLTDTDYSLCMWDHNGRFETSRVLISIGVQTFSFPLARSRPNYLHWIQFVRLEYILYVWHIWWINTFYFNA